MLNEIFFSILSTGLLILALITKAKVWQKHIIECVSYMITFLQQKCCLGTSSSVVMCRNGSLSWISNSPQCPALQNSHSSDFIHTVSEVPALSQQGRSCCQSEGFNSIPNALPYWQHSLLGSYSPVAPKPIQLHKRRRQAIGPGRWLSRSAAYCANRRAWVWIPWKSQG